MKASNFDIQSYFSRIGYNETASADFATLKSMMRCQLFSVPFENLDVQGKKGVSLVPEDIYVKIVERGRGGYCYEVNGVFAMALEALGIPYQFIAARPMFYPVRRPKTHMAIIATLDGEQWLCDLGFGSYGIREPINLNWLDREIRQDFDKFKLSGSSEHDYLLQAFTGENWVNQYEFNLCPQEWIDFAPANYMNSTHPDAVFVQKLLIVKHNPSGREILFGDRLKSVSEGRTEEAMIRPEEIPLLLQERFSLSYQP